MNAERWRAKRNRELGMPAPMIRLVDLSHFSPHHVESPARSRGCLTCTHFHGGFYASHLLCECDGGRYVVGVPAMGCAFWEREPGG
jgi:hypothetical protein